MKEQYPSPGNLRYGSELVERARGDDAALAVLAGLSFYDEGGLGLRLLMAESWEELRARALGFLQTDKSYQGGVAWLHAPIWIRRAITDWELSIIRIWPFPDLASYIKWTEQPAPPDADDNKDAKPVLSVGDQMQSLLKSMAALKELNERSKNAPPSGNSTT
jgi:hypothetical protein